MNHAANDPPFRIAGTLASALTRVAPLAGFAGIAAITILSLVPGSERPHTGLPGHAEHFAAYACTGFAPKRRISRSKGAPDFLVRTYESAVAETLKSEVSALGGNVARRLSRPDLF
jgi:hypothetical protein